MKPKSSVPPMMMTLLPVDSAALNSRSLAAWSCKVLAIAQNDVINSTVKAKYERTRGRFMMNT
ncbi:hypothetical protein HV164_13495 [Citrobacter freundii]|uniref:Uncharacterized protein n=1 Tax=Citrobacter freundii TaxID=546 RepID=A0ABD7AZC1_CITFR|nr:MULTISPECIES: hypothetical protein [Citrobacter]QLX25924.1 hypothetical protein HV271_14415 [Citrobacter freundii]QLY37472.1 hypothetical protein HV164_13495 [Citrobacter freundii]QLY61410.1 hypothetical protein HV211_13375 [Citrobacter freundii]